MSTINKPFIAILIIALFSSCSNNKSKDIEAITKASMDYIEGWYEGNAERMNRALHPQMIKRFIVNPESLSSIDELDKDNMVSMTDRGGGKSAKDKRIEIKILDVQQNIASIMTISEYIDYLQLAKFENKWVIINVLWDFNRNRK